MTSTATVELDRKNTPLVAFNRPRCRFILPAAVIVAAVIFLAGAGGARAQDMEPRAYSAVPIDTNFLIGSYQRTTGAVSLDPSLPISNVKASINGGVFAYDRTFDLFGQTASAAVVLPYLEGHLSGNVGGQGKQISRKGLGDLVLRFTQNLIGNPALTPAEFAQRVPTTTLGVSVAIVAPTGDYNSQHLVNISAHRWAFKPEIGLSQPIGNWFVEGAAGVLIFTNNTDFFGGHARGQDPIWTFQAHAGYNFGPNFWLAADVTHYMGGRTSLDGVAGHDFQSVARYGFTLSIPLGDGFSAKASGGSWLTAHHGGGFDRIGLTLQYRWFDR
jgi:hypothetical protein